MKDTLLAIGEALIDMIPKESGVSFSEVTSFSPKLGGAPCNVCGAFSRLGGNSKLITQLGNDPFGEKITKELRHYGIGTEYISYTDSANTALAFVALDADGDRTFSFYRNPSADMLFQKEQLQKEWFHNAYALHFCSVSLASPSMRDAHSESIRYAMESGAIISFDPNLRFPLWKDQKALYDAVWEYLPKSHILKISHEELSFLTGSDSIEASLQKLFVGNVSLILYTCGGGTAKAFTRNACAEKNAPSVRAVDTTGAGDGFIGSFLFSLLQKHISIPQLSQLSAESLGEMLAFSHFFCSLSIQKPGAIPSYPTREVCRQQSVLTPDSF